MASRWVGCACHRHEALPFDSPLWYSWYLVQLNGRTIYVRQDIQDPDGRAAAVPSAKRFAPDGMAGGMYGMGGGMAAGGMGAFLSCCMTFIVGASKVHVQGWHVLGQVGHTWMVAC